MQVVRLAVSVVVGAAVGGVVLAGCSSGEQASGTLPSATAVSASPSNSLPPLGPADFPVPLQSRARTSDGASSFAAYYIDLTNKLLPSLDSRPLRDLSRDCSVCNQLADGYDADKLAGYKYIGGEIKIRSAGPPVIVGDMAQIAFILDQAAVTVVDSGGSSVADRTSDAYSLTGGMSLTWSPENTTWLATSLTAERQ